MDSKSARYAPMNNAHIPGFPNHLPHIEWQSYFPEFRDQEGDDVALHLVKFHMHILKLRVEFHEELEDVYGYFGRRSEIMVQKLRLASLYSLEYFYSVFWKNYKESYPSLLLVENFCGNIENVFLTHGN